MLIYKIPLYKLYVLYLVIIDSVCVSIYIYICTGGSSTSSSEAGTVDGSGGACAEDLHLLPAVPTARYLHRIGSWVGSN